MNYRELADRLDEAGCRTFWFGPANRSEVTRLEGLLGLELPEAFIDFLCSLGGGGVEGAELTGIDGTADHEGFGTIWGDTKRLREDYGLGAHLVVLRIDEEEYAWCLDCSSSGDSRVVGIALGVDSTPTPHVPNFEVYFSEYVEEQTSIAGA